MKSSRKRSRVRPRLSVVYNWTLEDPYEEMKKVDPASLGFEPVYPIDVATVEEEYAAVVEALEKAGFRAGRLNLEDDLERLHGLLAEDPPDVVFNLAEYFRDDPAFEPMIAGMFELHGVPYTGCPPFALSLCRRKGFVKRMLLAHGLPTPRYVALHQPHVPRGHGLRYPLIVKPAQEDASVGIHEHSIVTGPRKLRQAIERAFAEHQPPILVEEFVEGREIHVGVWGNDPGEVLPLLEYDFSDLPADRPRIVSHDMKWNPLDESFHRVHEVCPAPLPARTARAIRDAARAAYRLTGCRDYARLDARVDGDGNVFLLEVNPNPDLTEGVSFLRAAEEAGIGFPEALGRIARMALERGARG